MDVSKGTSKKDDMRNVIVKEKNNLQKSALHFFSNLLIFMLLLGCNYDPWTYYFSCLLTATIT